MNIDVFLRILKNILLISIFFDFYKKSTYFFLINFNELEIYYKMLYFEQFFFYT